MRYYLTDSHTIAAKIVGRTYSAVAAAHHELAYAPSVGNEMGTWWGEAALGDMSALDDASLVYDLTDLTLLKDFELFGSVEVHTRHILAY